MIARLNNRSRIATFVEETHISSDFKGKSESSLKTTNSKKLRIENGILDTCEDSHSYLLYSSSHMSRIPFLILSFFVIFVVWILFSLKSEEMCDFFYKYDYPASVAPACDHRAQLTDQRSALQT